MQTPEPASQHPEEGNPSVATTTQLIEAIEKLVEVAENPLSILAIQEMDERIANAKRIAAIARDEAESGVDLQAG